MKERRIRNQPGRKQYLPKAEIEYGPRIFTDSEGKDLDTAQTSLERYELPKLNPTAEESAAAKVKYGSLSWEKYP